MNTKYQNGMYKSTSKKQDVMSTDIFKTLHDIGVLSSMSIDFNQVNGECEYKYAIKGQTCEYVLTIDRTGHIVNRAWEG